MAEKSGVAKRREEIRQQHFAADDLWTGVGEKGWFVVPRSLPLVLALLSSKAISNNHDPSSVYLELLSRQRGEGVIELSQEDDHAFAAGYVGTRAVRTWQERMRILEENGFIRTAQVGNQRYKYVAIIHPTTAVERLHQQGKIESNWWNAYLANKRETKEPTHSTWASTQGCLYFRIFFAQSTTTSLPKRQSRNHDCEFCPDFRRASISLLR